MLSKLFLGLATLSAISTAHAGTSIVVGSPECDAKIRTYALDRVKSDMGQQIDAQAVEFRRDGGFGDIVVYKVKAVVNSRELYMTTQVGALCEIHGDSFAEPTITNPGF